MQRKPKSTPSDINYGIPYQAMGTSTNAPPKVPHGSVRSEDDALLRGAGGYTDDFSFSDEAFGLVLRSPHPAAEIRSIDTTDASRVPGVLGILTAADLESEGLGPLGYMSTVDSPEGGKPRAQSLPILADSEVRFVGQPVAFVVADTRAAAQDCLELIDVDYDARDHIVDLRGAVSSSSPRVDSAMSSNVAAEYRLGDRAACERAMAEAWRTVSITIANNRVIANAMEPRAAIAQYSEAEDRWTLICGTQAPHLCRKLLAEEVFGIAEDRIRIKVGRLGGGFGSKITPYPEDALVMIAARRFGRPVRWRAERSDSFLSDYHSRDHLADITLAFDPDLHITAMQVCDLANLGAYPSAFGIPIATTTGNRIVNGVYDVPIVSLSVRTVLTNTTPTGPYRGAGRPEVIHRLEMAIEAAGRAFSVDPVEIRRRNLIAPDRIPYRAISGLIYDSGDFPSLLEKALAAAEWDSFAARAEDSSRAGRLRGRGVACHIDSTSGLSTSETVLAEVDGRGRISYASGTQEMGQGIQSTYAQIAARALGVPVETIMIVQGDTDRVPSGTGSYGSRSLYIGGAAIASATETLIGEAIRLAVPILEASQEDLSYEAGSVRVVGTNHRVSLAEIAQNQPRGTFKAEASSESPFCFPNGCYVCEVEIDRETGEISIARFLGIDDVGRVLNPTVVHGQVHGGIVQGIGQAIYEQVRYDEESGQLLSGSLMDYALPRASDVPFLDSRFDEEQPASTNPFGVKGAGESGAVGAPPALMAAVLDALRDYSVDGLDMPLTAEKIWRTMAQGPAAHDRG